jgi:hypothetical protein
MSKGPHIRDEQLVDVIERVANGMSLKQSLEVAGFSYANAVMRISGNADLKDMLARAREDYQALRVDQMHEIASMMEDVPRARLICDNIKWEAARISPKVYGDRIRSEHTGADGGAIQIEDARAPIASLIAGVLPK